VLLSHGALSGLIGLAQLKTNLPARALRAGSILRAEVPFRMTFIIT
jgi:hypothetical protein